MERGEYLRMADLEDTMWWYRGLHGWILERLRGLHLAPGDRVLDAGCGTGGLLRRLREDLPRMEFVGVEYDRGAIAIAAEKTGAALVNGTINSLPFASGSFHAIVSADVLCHRGVDEQASLAEFLRCLKPGGSLLLHLPAYEWLRSSHDEHVHSIRRYTAGGLCATVERTGFRVARCGYRNSLLFGLMLVYRRTVGRSRSASDVRAYPGWLDSAFRLVLQAELRMARAGLSLPFGGSAWLWATKG